MPTSIVDIAARHTDLVERRGEWWGCCPFHQEKTPSFSVSPEKGKFYCFGCHQQGDAIDLLQELDHKSFREAAAIVGKDLDPRPAREVEQRANVLRHQFQSWCFAEYFKAYHALRRAREAYEVAEIAQRYHRRHPGEWDGETISYWAIQHAMLAAEFYHLQRKFLFWIDDRQHQARIARWRESHA